MEQLWLLLLHILCVPCGVHQSKSIDTIEYNLEQLDDLSVDELEVLKETTDSLIEHIEKIKLSRAVEDKAGNRKRDT